MPPRAVWDRIREQAEAEGLIRQGVMRRPMTWNGGLGLAAAVALVAVLIPAMVDTPDVSPGVTEPPITANTTGPAIDIDPLQA